MGRTESYRVTMHFDGRPEPIRALRSGLASFLQDRSVDPEIVRAVVLAFGEALDNACEHGTGGNGLLQVRMRYTPRFIHVSLLDPGGKTAPLGVAVEADHDSERGRGFLLMNKLMDVVRVKSFPAGGTRVSMLRRLGPRR